MNNYNVKLRARILDEEKIAEINKYVQENPGEKVLVTIPNTRGLSSNMLRQLHPSVDIRVIGGYHNKLNIGRYQEFETKTIYTRNELINIVGEMEKIESGMKDSWSDYQKLIYLYNTLKRDIKYDPKYESKDSSDIRTLRGLVTKQTVCAGYSIILKELLDRQGIKAEYVGGNVPAGSGHAWNIVEIEGKKYPIDLTWDASGFRSGRLNSRNYLGQNTEHFRQTHIPGPWEPIQNYEQELSSIPDNLIKKILTHMNSEQEFASTTYMGTRDDGSKFLISQVANSNKEINGKIVYRYIYCDYDNYGRPMAPITLYSTTNIQALINAKDFNRTIPQGYEWAIDNVLFSVENINNSLQNGTFYVGYVDKYNIPQNIDELQKPQDFCDRFSSTKIFPTRNYTRSDGSKFVVQQMLAKPVEVNGVKLMKYDIFEVVQKNGMYIVKRNTVWTEMNILKDNRQEIADVYLSRARLDRKAQENGGYIGVYSQEGFCLSDEKMLTFFDSAKTIGNAPTTKRPIKNLPTFDELRNYAVNYTMDYVPDENNPGREKLLIKDKDTGRIVTDLDEQEKIVFAHTWLQAAGVKWHSQDTVSGETYAFNEPARRAYNYICNKLCDDIQKYGVIDTVALFKEIEGLGYKYGQEIVVNLFRSEEQTEYLNDYFNSLYMLDKVPTKPLKPLITFTNAYNLQKDVYGD